MWYLVLVLLTALPGVDQVTMLNPEHPFVTEADCLVERDRVGFAMAEAYPYERDFFIACYEAEDEDRGRFGNADRIHERDSFDGGENYHRYRERRSVRRGVLAILDERKGADLNRWDPNVQRDHPRVIAQRSVPIQSDSVWIN